MKIFFDVRWTRIDTHFGVSRYGAHLAEALAKLHPVTLIIHDERQLRLLPKDLPYVKLNNPLLPSELFIARKLNKLGADIVYSPMQVMGSWGRKYKLILTLHDLIYYTHTTPPKDLPGWVRAGWWLFHQFYWPQRVLLNRADHVATVSKTVEREIAEHHLTDRPVDVVYNAPTLPPKKLGKHEVKKDLVFMGNFIPYKNAELLIAAMPLLPEYTLHLVSAISPERERQLKALAVNPKQIKFWRGISDADYARLLATSTALVTATRAEGFGIPVIEAMDQGTPVICSDIPILHEVGGDAALYFDPDSTHQFAEAVRKLEDTTVRQKLIERGYKQGAKFSWEQSAKELQRIIAKVATSTDKK